MYLGSEFKAFAFGEPLSFASPKESGAKKRRPQVAAKARPKIVRPRRLGNSLVATGSSLKHSQP